MKVIITLKKSVIGSKPEHIATVKALGLKKTNSSVVKNSPPRFKAWYMPFVIWLNVKKLNKRRCTNETA